MVRAVTSGSAIGDLREPAGATADGARRPWPPGATAVTAGTGRRRQRGRVGALAGGETVDCCGQALDRVDEPVEAGHRAASTAPPRTRSRASTRIGTPITVAPARFLPTCVSAMIS